MNRFLLISPYFAPSSRIGAKRALNLVRHLPGLGWEPVVLCCPRREGSELLGQEGLTPTETRIYPEFGSWLGRTLRGRSDRIERLPQLQPRVQHPPAEPPARRIPLLGPGLEAIRRSDITPLDQYMWDIPFLIGRASRIARGEGVRAIVVNADPWSGLVVGAAVARRLGLPLIADLRDPWALHPRRQPRRTAITRAAVFELERRLLRRADRIVLNTEHCAAAYRDHYAGAIEEERFTFIRNAFDASIYHAPIPSAREGFAIHYFGTVGSGRDPSDFYVGLARFLRDIGPAAADVKVVFHGDAGPMEDPRVEELGLRPHIEVAPHAPLRDTLRRLHEADILLLIEGEERTLQLPAKLYDYLAAERPILAVGAHTELANILERTGAGVSTSCGDGPDATARRLRELYLGRQDSFVTDEKAVDEFRANAQAMCFRQHLDEVVQEPARAASSPSGASLR